MTGIQPENGHTDLANELLEAMGRFRIPGMERQVFDVIMRKTWGWKKKCDRIALSQLVEATGMSKPNVSRSLSKLIINRLVIKSDNKLQINKNYLEWIPFGVIKSDNGEKLSKVITNVIKSDNRGYSKVSTTKETITKETIQKGKAETFLEAFNKLRGTNFRTTLSWSDNFAFWLKSYSLEEIIRAVKLARFDPWMDEVITPELLFRTRNKNGSCDYIGKLLNIKVKLSEEDKLLKEGLAT